VGKRGTQAIRLDPAARAPNTERRRFRLAAGRSDSSLPPRREPGWSRSRPNSPTSNGGWVDSSSTSKPRKGPRRYASASRSGWPDWKTPSPTGSNEPANSPSRPTAKRPRWPTSPRCSTGYPILVCGLTDTPQRALRAWFDALQLEITYQPAGQAIDVALTLCDNLADQAGRHETSEDWSVPPAVSWVRTSEWGVSRHRNSVSQVFGMADGSQGCGMSKRRLVIAAVLAGQSQSEVARTYGVSQGWISRADGPLSGRG
jgi:hypothetical protein